MHFPPILTDIVILFVLSIGVNILCARIRLPSTVGFLLTGILCGPSLLGVVSDTQSIDVVAEIGVALLLFTIGMELSGDALNRLKKPVFLGGSLQIGLTLLIVTTLLMLMGRSLQMGIFAGCMIALSSSAIVLRILQERGTTNTPPGRLSLAILVFQDILVAPMLLAVPLLAGTSELSLQSMGMALAKIFLLFGGIFLFAKFILSRLMRAVVRTRNREILLLTTLGLCMGLALLTSSVGLSLSLGAFLAGLLLARSEYSMSVISGVLPYKDVFMSIFFISVGMLLNVQYVANHAIPLLAAALFLVVLKFLLTLPAVLVQGYPLRTAVVTSLSLAQVGEFSFVLAASGLALGLIVQEDYQLFLAISICTMMLTPGMIAVAPKLSEWLKKRFPSLPDAESEESGHTSLHDHLIIIGYGVSGQHLAQVARESGIPYCILEMNPETISRYRDTEPISHGDASQPVVLEHLGIHQAKVLAIVISDPAAVRATIVEARNLNPSIYIVARTRFSGEIGALQNLGANDVIAEEFESSLEVFSHVLTHYLIPQQRINCFIERIRNEQYKKLRSLRHAEEAEEDVSDLIRQLPDISLHAVTLGEDSSFSGKTLAEAQLRSQYGVTVVGVNRNNQTSTSPDADFRLCGGDILYIFGTGDKVHDALPFFLSPEITPATAEEKTI